ncbi:MAG: orotate phosphoribosyltransferase [Candidatus Hinthialibacter sp.]
MIKQADDHHFDIDQVKERVRMFENAAKILEQDLDSVHARLAEIIQEKSIQIAPPGEPFILTSGKQSHYYINGKLTAGDPEGLFCIARLILEEAKSLGAEAVGGPTLGADPIVGAIAVLSHLDDAPMPLFIVRKEAKPHGARQQVEGSDIAGKKVVIVEDVITTGGSVFKAINAVRELGAVILKVICLVDREQGGREAFEEESIPYQPLFFISELVSPEVLQGRR